MLLTNLTITRFQRKIRKFRLARSQSVTICFQVRIVKKEKKKKAILSTTTENLVTPAPPTPDKGSIREIATGEITVSITPDDHLEGPYLLKTRELPGALPLGPRQGPYGGALDPTRMRRALTRARCASRTDFSAHPFFCKSWIRHCTHPPLLVQVAYPPLSRYARYATALYPVSGKLTQLFLRKKKCVGVPPPPPPPVSKLFLHGSQSRRWYHSLASPATLHDPILIPRRWGQTF